MCCRFVHTDSGTQYLLETLQDAGKAHTRGIGLYAEQRGYIVPAFAGDACLHQAPFVLGEHPPCLLGDLMARRRGARFLSLGGEPLQRCSGLHAPFAFGVQMARVVNDPIRWQ
jgi:hypothetical protein